MIRLKAMLTNKLGLHGRASSRLIHLLEPFDAEVIAWSHRLPNGRVCVSRLDRKEGSILETMMLAVSYGEKITFEISGPEEQVACEALKLLIQDGFTEETALDPEIEITRIESE